MTCRRTAILAHAAGFGGLFALGLAYSIGSFDRYDEAWFLAVVARLREGDVLYRDVWYGSGPLPAYLTEAVTWLVGVDIIAVKLVVVAALAAGAMLVWVIAGRLGIGPLPRLLVVAGMAYFSPAIPLSAYGPLTVPFILATLLAALVWQERQEPTARAVAALAGGAASGLAFSSKQNTGVYALAALVAVFAVNERRGIRRLVRPTGLAIAGFVMTAFLAVLPALLTGGLGTYLRRGFTGKTTYLQYSSLSYSNALHSYARSLTDVHTEAAAEAAYWGSSILLPLLAGIALLAIAAARWRLDVRAIPLVAFALVSTASLYPLGDAPHVVHTAGPLLLLCAYALHLWLPRTPRRIEPVLVAAIAAWVGVAIFLTIARPFRLALSPRADISSLPHIHGTFVEVAQEAMYKHQAEALAAAARRLRGPLFLLTPDAGFRYLTSGLRNPTAYDYPIVTTFGPNGQARVQGLLASGRIRSVCYGWWTAGLLPTQLITYVRSSMTRGPDLGPCTLYTR
jgi:hypothetical protein